MSARDRAFPCVPTLPIVVLKVARNVLHHGGLALARSVGRLGIPVYGLHEGRWTPAARSRYDRGGPRHPGAVPADRWVEELLGLGRRLGRAVLVPIDDDAVVLVADHAGALRERFVFAENSPELIRQLSDKGEMHRLCAGLDIPTPDCRFPTSMDDVESYAATGQFPVVVKQIAGWLPTNVPNAPRVVIAHTPQELRSAYVEMESPERPNVLVQDYIPGGPDTVWMFNGYFDADSECRVGFTGRKLRSRGPNTGPAVLGLCAPNANVDEATRRLMKEVGYQGILDIDYRYDAADGRYKLLDVNPRLGSTFRLFVDATGLDVARALYLDLTGQPVPPAETVVGRKWMDEPHDLVSSVQMAGAGELGFLQWLHSLRGIDELAWFATDDLLPFLLVGGPLLTHAARRAVRRRRSSGAPVPVGTAVKRDR